jgi:hypothetical protein
LRQRLLEQAYLPAKGGLRHAQQLCGAGKAAALGDGEERTKLPELHWPHYDMRPFWPAAPSAIGE